MVISLVFFLFIALLEELLDVSENAVRPSLLSAIALTAPIPSVLNSLLFMNVPYSNSFPQIPILKQKRGRKNLPKVTFGKY